MRKFCFFLTLCSVLISFSFTLNFSGGDFHFHDYVVKKSGDTTFCYVLEVHWAVNKLIKYVKYIPRDGKETEIERDSAATIKSICFGGNIVDLIPESDNFPDILIHCDVAINGKIRTYSYIGMECTSNKKRERTFQITDIDNAKIELHHLERMKIGNNYYNFYGDDIKDYLAPYCNSCKAFVSQWQYGEITSKNAYDAVILYNKVCQ